MTSKFLHEGKLSWSPGLPFGFTSGAVIIICPMGWGVGFAAWLGIWDGYMREF